MGISMRTFQRWTQESALKVDGRPGADRPPPENKLNPEERQAVLDTVNSPAYKSLPPSQIVPTLADEGRYIASESTFYRILREEGQQQHRQARTFKQGNNWQGLGPETMAINRRYCRSSRGCRGWTAALDVG